MKRPRQGTEDLSVERAEAVALDRLNTTGQAEISEDHRVHARMTEGECGQARDTI